MSDEKQIGYKGILTNGQIKALSLFKQGKNMFITGGAGVGKSYLINEMVDYCKCNNLQVAVCAPTALAALNIHGVTIHSLFDFPPKIMLEDDRSKYTHCSDRDRLLQTLDVIIIDEISMCRIDLFDAIVQIIFKLNTIRAYKGKQSIQLVLVGDFFQLPPVMKDIDKNALDIDYSTNINLGYAFYSEYWNIFKFEFIELNEVVRQIDTQFIDALNNIRTGNRVGLRYIEAYSSKIPIQDAIYLSGTNDEVRDINNKHLAKIQAQQVSYKAEYIDDATSKDAIADDILNVKVGARVLMIVNDHEHRFVNGDFGYIKALGSNGMIVTLDNGKDILVEQYTWEVYGYGLSSRGRVEQYVKGLVKQFPLKLGYAVTIHKSQGQTYNNANINPSCWEVGQLYVALSRCKNVQGIHIIGGSINYGNLITSLDVIKFYNLLYAMNKDVQSIPSSFVQKAKLQSDNIDDLLSVTNKIKGSIV